MFLFFVLCLVAYFSCSSHSHASYLAALIFLFVCFYRSQFCRPAINQISLSQSKSWFLFILLFKQEKYHWTGPLNLRINYTHMISELYYICFQIPTFFHWRVETGLKQDFIMNNYLRGLWILKIFNCAINESQVRTTYCLSTRTIIL